MMDTVQDILARGFWDSTVKIAKIKGTRHTAIFPENERPTKVTFCNFCGSSLLIGYTKDDGEPTEKFCSGCGMADVWIKENL